MEEYKSNSHRSQEAGEDRDMSSDRKIEKVVSGGVRRGKKSGVSKMSDVFVPGDIEDVKSYILMEVLVPSIKRAISDIVCNGVNMLLGEPTKKSGSSSKGARVSYRAYYEDRDDRRESSYKSRNVYSYDDIIFDNRGDAERVLDDMEDLLNRFDVVSVADLLGMCDLKSTYMDNKYGWTDVSRARVERVRDGYVIRLPRATIL